MVHIQGLSAPKTRIVPLAYHHRQKPPSPPQQSKSQKVKVPLLSTPIDINTLWEYSKSHPDKHFTNYLLMVKNKVLIQAYKKYLPLYWNAKI